MNGMIQARFSPALGSEYRSVPSARHTMFSRLPGINCIIHLENKEKTSLFKTYNSRILPLLTRVRYSPDPVEQKTDADIEEAPGRMLGVLPVVYEKCGDHKEIAYNANGGTPEDERVNGFMFIVRIHRIFTLYATSFDIYS